ncbi:MAG: BamA/TamA family outer membrane protein [Thermotogae bacterium]|nr:BamA/TamA family outer membrane protein [Thermotogota bacterium]
MILLLSYTYIVDVKVVGAKFFKPSFIKRVFGYRRPFLGFGRYARYSPSVIRHRAIQLENIYRDSGFFDVRVEVEDSSVGRNKVIIVRVEEGPRYVIRRIVAPKEFLRHLNLKLPRPYSASFVAEVELALIRWYQDRGYPFVEVSRELYAEDTMVDVVFNVREGPRVVIRDIRFKSADSLPLSTRRKIFYREVVVKPGECFSISRIQESLSRLYRTLLFTSVRWKLEDMRKAREGECGDSSAVLVFYVREGAPRILDITAGLQSETERPVLLNFETSFQHLNLFNNLQRIQLSAATLFDLMTQRVENFSSSVVYQEPYFLDFYLRANFKLSGDYDANRETAQLGMYGEIVKPYILNRVEVSAGPSIQMRIPTGDSADGRYTVVKLFQRAYFDTRDNIFDPSWGSVINVYVEETGFGKLGDYDFLKGIVEVSVYQRFFLTAWKWAARVKLGKAGGILRSDTLPFYDRFTLGGEGQVRGYDRFSIGESLEECYNSICKVGNDLVIFNYEIRRRIWREIGGVVFFDFGYLSGDYGYSAGLGLRYFTPIGPIRVDWGLRLKDRSPTDRGKIYVGIGHMF